MAVLNAFAVPVLSYLTATFIVFALSTIVYRLTLHPLASFPGPKLAAMTNMYGALIDLSSSSSSYVKTLPALHARYGQPALILLCAISNEDRTHNPSVASSTQYSRYRCIRSVGLTDHEGTWTLTHNRIFKAGTKFSKESSFYISHLPLKGSLVQILETKDAMARKVFYNSYFSREHIRRAEPLIQVFSSKFLHVLKAAASEAETKTVNLSMGFRCLAADTIMDFTLNKPLGALEWPDFDIPMMRALKEAIGYGLWTSYFPGSFTTLFRWIDKLPDWFLTKYVEPLALIKWFMTVSSLCFTLLMLNQ